ncbi:MAG: tryptophan 2,3-dioxygenase family protein [Bdellovibrionia bacterium]
MKHPPVHYHEYLQIDKLLDSQHRKSAELGNPAHDEWLFIIVHQTYELWFKQIILELDSVLALFQKNPVNDQDMRKINHRLQRIISIFKLVSGQIDVLETMTPLDFLDFREYLYPASGFQSFQFRLIETKLGLKAQDRLNYNQGAFYNHLPDKEKSLVMQALQEKSLLECIESWLERTPFLETETYSFWQEYQKAAENMFNDDISVVRDNQRLTPEEKEKNLQMLESMKKMFSAIFHETEFKKLQDAGYFKLSFKAIQAALLVSLYRDQPLFHIPYQILQNLLDIDELMTQWRYRHALMAHRMLGKKIGTGGSSGSDYLKSATENHKVFTDFFNLSTFLIPRSKVPALPQDIEKKAGFVYFNQA